MFSYEWTLADAKFTGNRGKVFSCFSGGGGSTMGYKLAGFDVIGINEIDKRQIDVYVRNFHPKYVYDEPIQTLKLREDLPKELYELDILDGSFPCSSFSVAGNTDKDWGKEKKFREGQIKQVLDTLAFDFIELAKRLQPKMIVGENVKGLLQKKAKPYVDRIHKELNDAGYEVTQVLMDGSKMGLPQRRQRVFFLALRKDLVPKVDKLNLDFNEKEIPYGQIKDLKGRPLTDFMTNVWNHRLPTDKRPRHTKVRIGMKPTTFCQSYMRDDEVLCTLLGTGAHHFISYEKPIYISTTEMMKMSSWPSDYDFNGQAPGYIMGMSVPPLMMASVMERVWDAWLSKV